MRRSIGVERLLAVVGLVTLAPAAGRAADVPPFGPALGDNADVVRAFHMKTTGFVTKEVTGKKGDGKTALVGQCRPTTWANFGIHQGTPMDDQQAGFAVITRGKIETGATGTFPLDKIYVDLFLTEGTKMSSWRFAGPGVLTLTTHDASPGKRRMIGTVQGKKLIGLEDEAKGKAIDMEASFDMEFSCGVK